MLSAGKQHLMAVGDAAGTLHILAIPWSLRQPTANEVRSILVLFSVFLTVILLRANHFICVKMA